MRAFDLTVTGSIFISGSTKFQEDATIDAAANINLDADGAVIKLKDDGTEFGRLSRVSSDLVIKSSGNNNDMLFKGVDGGGTITALTLDMSEGGRAIFLSDVSGSSTSTGSFGEVNVAELSIPSVKTLSSSIATGIANNLANRRTDTTISGSTTSLSSSIASDVASNLSTINTLKGSGTTQGVGQGNSPTFAAGTITGDLSVGGTLTAQEVHTEFESASILFTSGSTIFGNSSDDVHNMTGSLNISGSLFVKDGTLTVTDNVDFNGDLDVDGTTNLDVVDIDGNVTIGNTVVNPASGFADQTGIGLKHSATVPEVNISSDAAGLQVGRTSTGGAGNIAEFRKASNVVFNIDTAGSVSGSSTSTGSFASAHFMGTGGVGIGTNSPTSTSQLHVEAAKAEIRIKGTNDSASDEVAHLIIEGSSDRRAGITIEGDSNALQAFIGRPYDSPNKLVFETSGSERVRIDNAGKVGIGTNNPDSPLHVYGGSNTLLRVQTDGVAVGNANPGTYGTLHVISAGDTSITGSTFYDGYGETNLSGNPVGPHTLALSSTAEASTDTGIQNMGPTLVFRGQPGTGLDGGATFSAIAGTFDASNSNYQGRGNLRFFTSAGYVFGPQYGTELKERMKITYSGEIHLGYSGGGYVYLYEVDDNSNYFLMYTHTDTTFRLNHNGSGNDELELQTDGDLVIQGTLTESSDVRLKENIETIPDALSKVNQMRGVSYNKIGEEKVRIGMVADEVEKIIPELVSIGGERGKFDEDGFDNVKSLKYTNMVSVLVEAVKELTEKNDALEKRIEDLEK